MPDTARFLFCLFFVLASPLSELLKNDEKEENIFAEAQPLATEANFDVDRVF